MKYALCFAFLFSTAAFAQGDRGGGHGGRIACDGSGNGEFVSIDFNWEMNNKGEIRVNGAGTSHYLGSSGSFTFPNPLNPSIYVSSDYVGAKSGFGYGARFGKVTLQGAIETFSVGEFSSSPIRPSQPDVPRSGTVLLPNHFETQQGKFAANWVSNNVVKISCHTRK